MIVRLELNKTHLVHLISSIVENKRPVFGMVTRKFVCILNFFNKAETTKIIE